ncbi:MAG: glutathione S-transferase [Sneathiella sp.]|uniref:glutathione S-transferase family protein n=1 Tax=Sneathiella sp. TaxID=1964365 RepID=UPI000C37143D|nr:glutathione S-transferase family protein [Sneathiella sp.]MAZ03016.1 glutathione S-transferase [Sneathiella sp.]
MRALRYTLGSPYARGVRVLLHELDLEYEHQAELTTPSVEERASASPTLQVPTFWDDGRILWESSLIAEYLLTTYPPATKGAGLLAPTIARPGQEWEDRLTFATIQTLGTAATTISQMLWTGFRWQDNDYLTRGQERLPHLLGWLEARLPDADSGFFGDSVSAQDIFLTCHLGFIANRPLELALREQDHPRIAALCHRMEARPSFTDNPILWWDPDVVGYGPDGRTPLYAKS